jgi:tRNA A37 threonylcarbamoyltransferase TsaD
MVCLGIEGTAHTIGVGIFDQDCKVLANTSKMIDRVRPTSWLINPCYHG